MELLSLLPCWPGRALVGDVVSDLDLNEASNLKWLAMQLRTDGYEVGLLHGHVWIPEAEWTACQEAATRYLQVVYGDDEQEAVC